MSSSTDTQSDRAAAVVWRYTKLLIGFVLLVATLVFATQNADPVTVRFLGWRFEMSQSLLIFFVLAIGLVAGALTTGWLRWTRSRR